MLSVLICQSVFALQLEPLNGCIVWKSNICLLVTSTLLHMPSSVCPAILSEILSSTKNLHLAILSLCLNLTVHTPKCSIIDWFYVLTLLNYFMACKTSHIDLGNSVPNTLNGIKLTSLLESIFYVMHILFLLVLSSSLVNIMDFTFSYLRYLIFTESKLLLHCSSSIVWAYSSSCKANTDWQIRTDNMDTVDTNLNM